MNYYNILKFNKRIFVVVLMLILIQGVFAVETGEALLQKAKEYIKINTTFDYYYPKSYSYFHFQDKKDKRLYYYNYTWGTRKRIGVNNPTKFDCSGFLCFIGDLNAHYGTIGTQFRNLLNTNWTIYDAKPGDIIYNPQKRHVGVYQDWEPIEPGNMREFRVKFIDISTDLNKVASRWANYNVSYYDSKFFTSFKDDSIAPTIKMKWYNSKGEEGEVKSNEKYPQNYIFRYRITDNIQLDPSCPNYCKIKYIKGDIDKAEVNKNDKYLQFVPGDYELEITAYDWAKNESRKNN